MQLVYCSDLVVHLPYVLCAIVMWNMDVYIPFHNETTTAIQIEELFVHAAQERFQNTDTQKYSYDDQH